LNRRVANLAYKSFTSISYLNRNHKIISKIYDSVAKVLLLTFRNVYVKSLNIGVPKAHVAD